MTSKNILCGKRHSDLQGHTALAEPNRLTCRHADRNQIDAAQYDPMIRSRRIADTLC